MTFKADQVTEPSEIGHAGCSRPGCLRASSTDQAVQQTDGAVSFSIKRGGTFWRQMAGGLAHLGECYAMMRLCDTPVGVRERPIVIKGHDMEGVDQSGQGQLFINGIFILRTGQPPNSPTGPAIIPRCKYGLLLIEFWQVKQGRATKWMASVLQCFLRCK
jgi:hypothetical protein